MHKPQTKENLVLLHRAVPHPNPNLAQAPHMPLLPWLAQQTEVTTLGIRGRWWWVSGQQGPITHGNQHLEAIPYFGNPLLTAQL